MPTCCAHAPVALVRQSSAPAVLRRACCISAHCCASCASCTSTPGWCACCACCASASVAMTRVSCCSDDVVRYRECHAAASVAWPRVSRCCARDAASLTLLRVLWSRECRAFMVQRTEQFLQLAGIQVGDQTGHAAPVHAVSWRAGGVRSAMDAGVSVPMIMMLGRWRSIAWQSYFMQTKEDIRLAQAAIWRPTLSTPAPCRVGDLVPSSVFQAIDDREHALPQV